MNFLAHFHLAWPDEGLVAGGLEGDYYKGPLRGDLPGAIERGVRLHRAIDAYTDSHPLVQQMRQEFSGEMRRYAGILIDLSFDHYLSKHWDNYSDISLGDFNDEIYRTLQNQQQNLSDNSRRMVERLVEYNILGLYLDWEAVPASAARVGQRFRRHNPFTAVDQELAPARDMLEQTFLAFYPQLRSFSAEQQSILNQSTQDSSNIALAPKSP
jgi:acyl carrier protein phosphodiesterase